MLGAILNAEETAVSTIQMPMSLPAFIALKKNLIILFGNLLVLLTK